jgi:CubicO group peptidase (beta-lactamase class C family)
MYRACSPPIERRGSARVLTVRGSPFVPARLLAALAASLLVFSTGSSARAQDLNAILEAAMKDSQVPAMGLLVIRDGKVEAQAQHGVRRNDRSDPVQTSDVWHIGSDGKAMTATMIARLVDRGVLKWTTPLDQLLPDRAADMRPEYRRMTLVELLSHRAGLPHDVLDTSVFDRIAKEPQPPTRQRLEYIAAALRDAPVKAPGTAFSYSNTGYLIAAAAAERATGKSYETLMREMVFAPLGMASPGFGLTPAGQPQGHEDGHPASEGNPAFFAPAGNIYLSLRDWAKFCLDQMAGANGRGRLLKPETYRLMQTPQGGGVYAFGWGVIQRAMGRQGPVLTHDGSDGTWYAMAVLFPRTRSGALATANAGEAMGGKKADEAAIRALAADLAPAVKP